MDVTKAVTQAIINQADQTATSIIVHDFNETDNAIFCSLIDEDDAVLTNKRVFTYEVFPCEALTDEEKGTIKDVADEITI
jgi:hypothetical protein